MAFLDENFLLSNSTAQTLYHQYARHLPIIDYHNHLVPREICENQSYPNLTRIWLNDDHYKWRIMRANGISEEYITGNADDYEKFLAYARSLPQAVGNPLYHWSHQELRTFFGVYELINENNAPAIWEKVNAQLQGPGFRARDFLEKSRVEVLCTTDDPTDDLQYHKRLKENQDLSCRVLPSFRPDPGLNIRQPQFAEWIKKLEAAAGRSIHDYDDFLQAFADRVDYFHDAGCRISDHGLDEVPYAEATREEVAGIFAKRLKGGNLSLEEEEKYKTYTLIHLGTLYAEHGWVMQYHMNAMRNNNTRKFQALGPNTGFDSMNDMRLAYPVNRLLDAMDRQNALPRTILYSLNPVQNHLLASLIGNFQGDGIPGKIQLGPAWWFNDTKEGMIAQMKALAEIGLLGRFVGMLTDSRSFLSFVRHDYFRRILCNLIGSWAESGELPDDEPLLAGTVQNISYYNAKNYFGF